MANPPTENTTGAGTAPLDPTSIAPDVDEARMREGAEAAADAAGAEGAGSADPIGGEATVAATSWGGASDEELETPPAD